MNFTIIETKKIDNLVVMQIYLNQKKSFDHISGRTATQKKHLEIKEITESGSVNEIIVINKSKYFVFLMDSDILVGAKQNRVVNTSILLAPFSKTELPVSCIERDRWHHTSEKFHFSDNIIPDKIRVKKALAVNKNLEEENLFMANQHEVWSEVTMESKKHSIYSDTNDLDEILRIKKKNIDSQLKNIKPNKNANGVIVFINKKITSADFFGSKLIYAEYFKKIVMNGFADREQINKSEFKNLNSEKLVSKANKLFAKIKEIEYKKYKGVGVGTELRGETKKYSITQLKHKSSLIHLSILRKTSSGNS